MRANSVLMSALLMLIAATIHGDPVDAVHPSNVRTTEAKPGDEKRVDKKAADTDSPSPSPDDQARRRVINLVKTHLPQLEPMLTRLRKQQPRQYQRAIRDLERSARRLENAKRRDEQLYEIEVDLLRAQTDVNILAARLKVRDDPRDRDALRTATQTLAKAELVRGQYDIDALQSRVEKMTQQLEAAKQRVDERRREMETSPDSFYQSWLRKAGRN